MLVKVFLFLLICGVSYGQSITLHGKVKAENNQLLKGAIIRVYYTDGTIGAFGFSGSEGGFRIELKTDSVLLDLEVSHMGYLPMKKRFNTQEENHFEIILEVNSKELREVEIRSYPKSYIVKKDTLSYDMATVRDGTERNIGEALNKLPGISVDENGKILYQGSPVNKLMIDGNDVFGNQQHMTTRNLSAEMIDEAELLTNYRESPLDIGGGRVALNLKTNEKIRNKPVGDLALHGGVSEKYLSHGNVYHFSSKGNLSVLADANNVGESPMTLNDYIELRKGISSLVPAGNSGMVKLDMSQFPKFLLNDNNIRSKSNNYLAANLSSKLSTKLELKAYSIFNNTLQSAEAKYFRRLFDTEDFNFKEEETSTGKLNFNTSYLNIRFLSSRKSFLNYTLTYNLGRDFFDKDVNYKKDNSTGTFLTNISNRNQTIGNNLEYQLRIADNIRIINNLSVNEIKNFQKLSIGSDTTLPYWNIPELDQIYNTRNADLILSTSISFNLSKFNLLFGYSNQNTVSELFSQFSENENKISMRNRFSRFYLNGDYSLLDKINLNVKNTLLHLNTSFLGTKSDKVLYEPQVSLSYNPLLGNRVSFTLHKKNEFPVIENLILHPVITDYRSMILNKNINTEILPQSVDYSLNYSSFKTKKERFFNLNIRYSKKINSILRTNSILNNASFLEFVYAPRENVYTAVLMLDSRIYKSPLYFKGRFFINYSEGINYVNQIQSDFSRGFIETDFKLGTRFRKSHLQIHADVKLNQTSFYQEVNKTASKMTRMNTNLRLTGIVRKVIYELKFTEISQRTSLGNHSLFMISPEIRLPLKNTKLELSLRGNNVFNLSENKILFSSFSNIGVSESEIQILDGYLMAGLKFKFR
jgi:hypothetical protein